MAHPARIALLLGLGLGLGAPLALAQEPVIERPHVVEQVEAEVPESALRTEPVEVSLEVLLEASGVVSSVTLLESRHPVLDLAAVNAVKKWLFSPATRNGIAVPAKIRVRYGFPARSVAVLSPPNPQKPALTHEPSLPRATPPPVEALTAPAANAATTEVLVEGLRPPPSRGGSDFFIEVGQLAAVPRKNAASLLELAPGILLTNEGGEGHAHQIFLRGFDAREGQDLELTVDSVPINELGNIHGNGHAETNFIIPETVLALRVLEGPFEPHQGNFAVAGSADYHLGWRPRGITLKSTLGSYGTKRLLVLYGPEGMNQHTFGAAELNRTDGYGQNRDATRASAIAQVEGKLSEQTRYRVVTQAYVTHYGSAGLLREDDYRAGRVGFFDTYDTRQGGDSSRYSVALELGNRTSPKGDRALVYLIRRDLRMVANFTGYLSDVQLPQQTPHAQRGDALDTSVSSFTLGSRGSKLLRQSIGGLAQTLEAGYAARGDFGSGTQLRLQSSNGVPYRRELDLDYALGDIGLFVDAALRPLSFLTLRGGIRANHFAYNVLDNCAQNEVRQGSRTNPAGDESCLSQQDFGRYRDPTARSSTAASVMLPRASLLLSPAVGLQLSLGYGEGVRSMDPSYISDDRTTPFARVEAMEAAVMVARTLDFGSFAGRVVAFRTHVDRDLIFSETEGRNTLAEGTTRLGGLAALRFSDQLIDQNLSVTLVRSRFDDTGNAVPYVPSTVVRSDTTLRQTLPFSLARRPLIGTAGLGVTYIGRRALPYDQTSDVILSIDTSTSLRYQAFELGLEITNLLNRRYRLGEYNYASYFAGPGGLPTLVPVRHFTAGAPRMVFVSLTVDLDEGAS